MNLLQYWYCFYYVLVFQPWDLWDLCSLRATHLHFSVHRNFPGKNTGGGGHFLCQGIFLTQGSNLCLLHQQADSLLLEPTSKPLTPHIRDQTGTLSHQELQYKTPKSINRWLTAQSKRYRSFYLNGDGKTDLEKIN